MNQKSLNKIFRMTQKELKTSLEDKLKRKYEKVISDEGFLYAEGTLPVILVAHLDTVHHEVPSIICYSQDSRYVMSPQGIGGDDKCGVIAILSILQETDLRPHIIFTEDEEIGGIGANKFCKKIAKVNANYIIEIDRKGDNDCVFYDCDNEDFTKFVEGFGFETDYGSFSDISTIAPHLGIAAVNLSSGYYNPHTNHEYVDLIALRNVIERVKNMLKTESSKFEYIEGVKTQNYLPASYYTDLYRKYYSSGYYDDDEDDDDYYSSRNYGKSAKTKKKKGGKQDEVEPTFKEGTCPECGSPMYYWSTHTSICYECGSIISNDTHKTITNYYDYTYSK